jgi:hypothetical protein
MVSLRHNTVPGRDRAKRAERSYHLILMHSSRRQILLATGAAATLAACKTEEAAAPARAPSMRARDVKQLVDAQATSDGAGVKLRRSLGSRALSMLDPFLMLDEFRSDRPDDYLAGFPSHPHRGFETVTYMIDGAMEHQDSMGNKGRLGPGSIQWMTAGSGIIHSEMPKQERGLMWGFQLWVNLPAAKKMTKPRYQDLAPERVETVTIGDATVRLVAGEAGGKRGPVDGIVTAPQMLDFKLGRRGKVEHAIPAGHNAFVYCFEGSAEIGPARTKVGRGQLAVLGSGDGLTAAALEDGARLLLLAGQPLGEPVARHGPFVMNTDEEIRRAVDDYRAGRLVQDG